MFCWPESVLASSVVCCSPLSQFCAGRDGADGTGRPLRKRSSWILVQTRRKDWRKWTTESGRIWKHRDSCQRRCSIFRAPSTPIWRLIFAKGVPQLAGHSNRLRHLSNGTESCSPFCRCAGICLPLRKGKKGARQRANWPPAIIRRPFIQGRATRTIAPPRPLERAMWRNLFFGRPLGVLSMQSRVLFEAEPASSPLVLSLFKTSKRKSLPMPVLRFGHSSLAAPLGPSGFPTHKHKKV